MRRSRRTGRGAPWVTGTSGTSAADRWAGRRRRGRCTAAGRRRPGLGAGRPRPIIGCDGWGARPNRGIVTIWDRRPVKILVHHTATPNVSRPEPRGGRGGSPAASSTSTWTTAAGSTPASTSRSAAAATCWRAGTAAWRCCAAGERQVEGAHCTGQNVVAVGHRERGHLHRGRSAARAVEPAASSMCALHLQAVRDRADRDLRAPRLQGHRLPRRRALPDAAAAAHRGGRRARRGTSATGPR